MIIYILGQDNYQSAQKVMELKAKFLKEVDSAGTNLITLDSTTTKPDYFMQVINSAPFLAKKKMVIFKNFVNDCKNNEILEAIDEIIKKDDTNDILVFWESESIKKGKKGKVKTNLNDKIRLKLANIKLKFEFEPLTNIQVENWIKKKATELSLKLDQNQVQLIASKIGNDLWQLENELIKLSNFSQNKAISNSDISLLIKSNADADIWKLIDAILNNKPKLAIKLISDQLQMGTNELLLLSMIINQFKILLEISQILNVHQNLKSDYIAQMLKIHPFVAKKLLALAQNYKTTNIIRIFRLLLLADLKIKSSTLKPKLVLEQLVLNIG